MGLARRQISIIIPGTDLVCEGNNTYRRKAPRISSSFVDYRLGSGTFQTSSSTYS
ncbi:hypothetical protein M758_UG025100 [Ceratodon purpureus]|nr:hypothetical protein M758_UG025100 [Ceratodon purpureus]